MRYTETPAPAGLADVVRCVWTLDADPPPAGAPAEPVIPDGCAEIVLNLADPFERIEADAVAVRQPVAMIVGQITAALRLRPTGRTRLVGIRLQPWAGADLLGLPMGELRDRQVDAADVAPALTRLRERLGATPTDRRASAVIAFLAEHARPGAPPAVARAAVERITTLAGRESIGDVARHLGVTTRTVEREMRKRVGVAPRELRRIARVQQAVRLLREAPAPALGRVGLRAGYFDHAHFCREFRRMAGLSPSGFLARERGLADVFLE